MPCQFFLGHDAVLVLRYFDDLPFLDHDLAALVLHRFDGRLGAVLRVVDGKIGQFHGHGVTFYVGLHFNRGHVVEDDLILLDCSLVEHFGGDVLGLNVDALRFGFVQHVRKQAHFELEAKQIDFGDVLLPAFENDLFDEETSNRQIHRADDDHAAGLFAVKRFEAGGPFCFVGSQDQREEIGLFGFELLVLFFFAQVGVDADEVLPFVTAEVENLKSAIVVAGLLPLALHADQPFACRVNGELAEIADNPLAIQFLGHRRGGAGPAEEIGDDVVFVGGGVDDAGEEGFGFLGRVIDSFVGQMMYFRKLIPDVLDR